MKPICLHDRDEIEQFLRQNHYLNLYALGDLDDFFWQYTTWYGYREADKIQEIALVYTGTDYPVLLALTDHAPTSMQALLQAITPFLPRRFYSHLTDNLLTALTPAYTAENHGRYYKMALTDRAPMSTIDTRAVIQLTPHDLTELTEFYAASYPGNWFDSRMLETGQYYALRHGAELVCVAGIHVYSPRYKVAALGNITTRPNFRGRGLATQVTAKLCQILATETNHIGLNVRADNAAAISCYQKLGFEQCAIYYEYAFE